MSPKKKIEYLLTHPWMSRYFQAPSAVLNTPGMLVWQERVMLPWLTARCFTGAGEIVELGAFLGSSTVALACGLELNASFSAEQKKKRIHCYDWFRGEFEVNWIKQNTKLELDSDGRFLGAFKQHTLNYADYLTLYDGDLLKEEWIDKPIEILFVDAMKSAELSDKIVHEFFPNLIPGVSIVVMEDYLFYTQYHNVVVMDHFSSYFKKCGDTDSNSVLFLYTDKIPAELIQNFSFSTIPNEEKLMALVSALNDQTFLKQKEFIASQLAEFMIETFPRPIAGSVRASDR